MLILGRVRQTRILLHYVANYGDQVRWYLSGENEEGIMIEEARFSLMPATLFVRLCTNFAIEAPSRAAISRSSVLGTGT